MSLATGNQFNVFNWTESPIDDYIIDKVEEMKIASKQQITTNAYYRFKWYPGVLILNNDEDEKEISDAM